MGIGAQRSREAKEYSVKVQRSRSAKEYERRGAQRSTKEQGCIDIGAQMSGSKKEREHEGTGARRSGSAKNWGREQSSNTTEKRSESAKELECK